MAWFKCVLVSHLSIHLSILAIHGRRIVRVSVSALGLSLCVNFSVQLVIWLLLDKQSKNHSIRGCGWELLWSLSCHLVEFSITCFIFLQSPIRTNINVNFYIAVYSNDKCVRSLFRNHSPALIKDCRFRDIHCTLTIYCHLAHMY